MRISRLPSMWALLALVCLSSAAGVQQRREPRLSARLSTGIAKLGAPVDLLVQVEDAAGAQIASLPEVEGLSIGPIGAPSVQSMTQYTSGRTLQSQTLSWRIPVRPQRAGEYTLPSFKVTADGKVLQSAALTLSVVIDMKGEELGYLELKVSKHKLAAGEPFSLEMRLGWDAALSSEINYAELSLPWWRDLPGVIERGAAQSSPSAARVAIPIVGAGELEAEELSGESVRGKPYRVFRARRSLVATRPGVLEFPTSVLEFGTVEQTGGFLTSQVRKTKRYYVRAAELSIDVAALPPGAPLDYGGAIGSFSARASAEPRDVDEGDSIKFKVEWSGTGNCEFFEPPDPSRLDAFRGFRVFGHTELDKSPEHRSVVYDIAPLSQDQKEIPALPLPVFDPERWAYAVLSTQPLPIRVRPLKAGAQLPGGEGVQRFAEDLRDIHVAAEKGGAAGAARPSWLAAAGLVVLAGWLALRTLVRRRGDPAAPAARARRAARRRLARALERARTPAEERDALLGFLAARSGETSAAWQGRDVVSALCAPTRPGGPLAAEQAAALGQVLARADAAIWGGRPERLDCRAVLRLADELVGAGL